MFEQALQSSDPWNQGPTKVLLETGGWRGGLCLRLAGHLRLEGAPHPAQSWVSVAALAAGMFADFRLPPWAPGIQRVWRSLGLRGGESEQRLRSERKELAAPEAGQRESPAEGTPGGPCG